MAMYAPEDVGPLDPEEVNVPLPAIAVQSGVKPEHLPSRVPGADGVWRSSWRATLARRRASWRPGWDTTARCPADPAQRRGRGLRGDRGTCRGERWRELHADRVRVQRGLRRAGYVARHRYERERAEVRSYGPHDVQLYRYVDGPAVGCVAVDPWEMARKLDLCAAGWWSDLRRRNGEPLAVDRPKMCGKNTVCPVCAARRSAASAKTIRDDIASRRRAGERVGKMVLFTGTQRASTDEDLHDALERLKRAMRLMWAGRARARFIRRFESWYYGIEVTRSWAGKSDGVERPADRACWWHVHVHIVLELAVDDDVGARAWLGRLWRDVTDRVWSGWGWDPRAGGCAVDDDGEVTDWSGPWWQPIDPAVPDEVYQACKYPSPMVELDPVDMVEFLAAGYGRRWHEGGGRWRGLEKLAKRLAAEGDVEPREGAVDLGERICAPGGLRPDPEGSTPHVVWSLPYQRSSDVPVETVAIIESVGGWVTDREAAIAQRRANDPPDPESDGGDVDAVDFKRFHACAVLPRAWMDRSRAAVEAELAAASAQKTEPSKTSPPSAQVYRREDLPDCTVCKHA